MDSESSISSAGVQNTGTSHKHIQPGDERLAGEIDPGTRIAAGIRVVFCRCEGRIPSGTPKEQDSVCEFPKEYVELFGEEDPNCRNEGLLLLRVLPGQRDAALLWSDHFAGTLQERDFDRCVACPTLFRDKRVFLLCT